MVVLGAMVILEPRVSLGKTLWLARLSVRRDIMEEVEGKFLLEKEPIWIDDDTQFLSLQIVSHCWSLQWI